MGVNGVFTQSVLSDTRCRPTHKNRKDPIRKERHLVSDLYIHMYFGFCK
jgi:hypothetical protein